MSQQQVPIALTVPSNIPTDPVGIAGAFTWLVTQLNNWVRIVANQLNTSVTIPIGNSGGVATYTSATQIGSSPTLGANKLVLGGGSSGTPATPVSLGTSTQVLHGNASGAPTWAAVGNSDLTNSSVTLNGHALALGGSLSLALSDITTVPLTIANGGTGQTAYTDGQLLIGDSSSGGLDKANLTAGSGITITNGHGSISVAAVAAGSPVSSTVPDASHVALTTTTPATITSISLGPGTWDISGIVGFLLSANGLSSSFTINLSTTNNAFSGNNTNGTMDYVQYCFVNQALRTLLPVGPYRVTLATTTTYYLVAQAVFSSGTCFGYGTIQAFPVK